MQEDDIYDFSPREAEIIDYAIDRLKTNRHWQEFKEGWACSIEDFKRKPLTMDQIIFFWLAAKVKEKGAVSDSPCPPDKQPPEKIKGYLKEYDLYIERLSKWSLQVVDYARAGMKGIPKSFGEVIEETVEVQSGQSERRGRKASKYSGPDPRKLINQAVAAKDAGDWSKAIKLAERSLKAFEESPLEYPYDYNTSDLLRLPKYLHRGGKKEEAFDLLNKMIQGQLLHRPKKPITGYSALGFKAYEFREIYDAIALCYYRDKNYTRETYYRCLSMAAGLYKFHFAEKEEVQEGGTGERRRLETNGYKEILRERVIKYCKRSKTSWMTDDLIGCIHSSLEHMPNIWKAMESTSEKLKALMGDKNLC